MSPSSRITVFDTTLRDGEQAPGFSMDVPGQAGRWRAPSTRSASTFIEAGFPIASPADSEAVRQIARGRAAAGDCRAGALRGAQDIEEAARALGRRPNGRGSTRSSRPPISISRPSSACTRDGMPRRGRSTPSSSRRRFTDDVEFSAEDATRSDRDFLCRVIEAVIARRLRRPSTCPTRSATRRPMRSREFFAEIIARVPNADRAVFSAHCHNDLGLAVAQQPRGASRAACARSSARSTASASAPATRRSKSS